MDLSRARLNPTILHTVLLAVTTLIVSISGRTLLDMALSHISGPATIARWAQLSSLIDLTSAVACAGLSPGVTVLVARASNLDVQSMILRTSVMLGLACSALTLAGMIGVATMVDFAGFHNVGAHIQVLNDPTLRWTVFLVGIFAATPVLAMQAWQSQGNPKRSCWLTLAASTMTVTAAVMSPYLLDATGLRIGTLAPLMVLLAAMTISVPLTVWYSSQSWRPMMHNSGQFKALLTFLPAGLSIGLLPALMFATAVAVIAALQFMFYKTALGRAFRATSDDAEIAELMGLDRRRVYAWAMALCLGVVAIAGVFLAIRSNFDPFMGPGRLIFGFEAVIIGGLGNLWGTLAGGVILGVAQGLGAAIDPGWQILAGHVAFLLILAVKPRGLFPRMDG
jgi:branched-chain amino acid transport system permease protein